MPHLQVSCGHKNFTVLFQPELEENHAFSLSSLTFSWPIQKTKIFFFKPRTSLDHHLNYGQLIKNH